MKIFNPGDNLQNIDPSWRKNMILTHFSKSNIERLTQDFEKSYIINDDSPFPFLLNPKNYFVTFMFSNKIATLNIKGAMIF
jgi:hypothetical protein